MTKCFLRKLLRDWLSVIELRWLTIFMRYLGSKNCLFRRRWLKCCKILCQKRKLIKLACLKNRGNSKFMKKVKITGCWRKILSTKMWMCSRSRSKKTSITITITTTLIRKILRIRWIKDLVTIKKGKITIEVCLNFVIWRKIQRK